MKMKDKKPYNVIIFLITFLLLSFQFCAGGSKSFALSVQEERVLGQKFLANITKSFNLADDDFANEYINDLGQYLIRPVETKHFPFHFYIIQDNELNAFAGPGGHIFIFTGLIEAMDKIDELAAVICHEIGHISARHLAQRIEKSKKIGLATLAGMLAGVFIGGKAAGAIMTGTMAAGIQTQLHYSRNDERQADQLGFKYMEGARFDPSGMVTTLKKIQRGQWYGTDRLPPYLLTHPTGPERMSNLDVLLTHYTHKPENAQTAKFRRLFPFFKTILRARYLEARDAERLFRLELEKDPNSAFAHFGLGIVWKERSEYDRAINHLQRALKRHPESLPILRILGEAYQLKGEGAESIAVLEKALEIESEDRVALFLLAMSYQNLENYPKAIRLYEKLSSMKPVKDVVFYNLGVSYGRLEQLARAHYNFGIYFKRLGKIEKARFHFRKAEDLSRNDPSLRSRIHKAKKDLPSN